MSAQAPDPNPLDRLLSLARAATPTEPAATDVRRMVRRARLAGAARATKARTHRLVASLALGCAALASLSLAWPQLRSRLDAPSTQQAPRAMTTTSVPAPVPAPAPALAARATPVRVRLPSGDQLLTTPDSKFELRQASAQQREVALERGVGLFEVDPLEHGERFVVQTPHLQVQVRGTVFSVEVDGARTRVRVYEGKVTLSHVEPSGPSAQTFRTLTAGTRYGSDERSFEDDTSDPLRREALELATRRHSASAQESVSATAKPIAEQDAGPGLDPPNNDRRNAPLPKPTLAQASALLRDGKALAALLSARKALAAQDPQPSERAPWLALQGDALRQLGRAGEAVAAYQAALPELAQKPRTQTAFKAAELSLHELHAPHVTLELLDAAHVDAEGSSLRERALLLRIEALARMGQPLSSHATSYLLDYPDSAGAARVRALAGY